MGGGFSSDFYWGPRESQVMPRTGGHELVNLTGKDVKLYRLASDGTISFVATIEADKTPCYMDSRIERSEMYDADGFTHTVEVVVQYDVVNPPKLRPLTKYIVTDDVFACLTPRQDICRLGRPHNDGYIGVTWHNVVH